MYVPGRSCSVGIVVGSIAEEWTDVGGCWIAITGDVSATNRFAAVVQQCV